MRRQLLLVLSALLLLVGLSALAWQIGSSPSVLRLAVGPADDEDTRVLAAFAATLSRDHEVVRFRIVPTSGVSENARLLDDGGADLAVVRPDILSPRTGQSVAVLHRDAVLLLAPAGRGISRVPDLAGRKVGIVRGVPANGRILEALAAFFDIPAGSIATVAVDGPADLEAALRSGRIDAVMAVGTSSGRTLADTVAAVAAAGGGTEPSFIEVPEAEAVAARSPLLESTEVIRGAFGGAAARPSEAFRTLAVNYRLMASASLSEATVSELTRLLFTLRPRVAGDIPLANRIEAPDTSKSSVLPMHPGASAYYEGEVPTFFDRYEDWLYLGVMLLSVAGSAAAAFASRNAGVRRARVLGLFDKLAALVPDARAARSEAELARLEGEADEILATALGRAGAGALDPAAVAAFGLGLDGVRAAIAARRLSLASSGRRAMLHAAE